MTKVLEKQLSDIRESMIKNKQKETSINLTLHHLSMIITGLKMSNAFDDVLDEEIAIKHNRGMRNKLKIKTIQTGRCCCSGEVIANLGGNKCESKID